MVATHREWVGKKEEIDGFYIFQSQDVAEPLV